MNARFFRYGNFYTAILKFILFFILLYSLNALAVGSKNDSTYKKAGNPEPVIIVCGFKGT